MGNYVKRQGRERFLQAIKVGSLTNYAILGFGVEDLSITYDTDEETVKWVTQKSGSTTNKGYTLTSGVEQKVFRDDPLFPEIDKIRRNQSIGEDASGTLLNINLYDSDSEKPTEVDGELFNIEVVINEFGGQDDLSITYTINYQGSPKLGTVTIDYTGDTPTFTFSEGTEED